MDIKLFSKKKIILGLTIIGLGVSYNSSYALNNYQNNEILDQTNNSLSSSKILNDYKDSDIKLLNSYLLKQDYIGFYNIFGKINVQPAKQIKYLEEKKFEGHTPLYWLMADYYAKNKNEREAHKWLYIATIMTQQDAALCYDISSKYASQQLLRSFPAAPDLIRRTPQYTNDAMSDVIFFIQNLKTRTNPEWACHFGNQPNNSVSDVLIPRESWAYTRKQIFDSYISNFKK